jgi:hypothetical protein
MVEKVKIPKVDGREVELRFRANRRVAIRETDIPDPPPRELALMCMGERIELRFNTRQFGYVIYYMPAESERRLAELLAKNEKVTCVLAY